MVHGARAFRIPSDDCSVWVFTDPPARCFHLPLLEAFLRYRLACGCLKAAPVRRQDALLTAFWSRLDWHISRSRSLVGPVKAPGGKERMGDIVYRCINKVHQCSTPPVPPDLKMNAELRCKSDCSLVRESACAGLSREVKGNASA